MSEYYLKPCPFCAGDAFLNKGLRGFSNNFASGYNASVDCSRCMASIDEGLGLIARKKGEPIEENNKRLLDMMEDSIISVVSLWNTRLEVM